MVSKCLLESKVYENISFFDCISTTSCTSPLKLNHFIVKKTITLFFPQLLCYFCLNFHISHMINGIPHDPQALLITWAPVVWLCDIPTLKDKP